MKTALKAIPVLLLFAVAACATHEGIHDPYEEVNRKNHALNKSLDRAILRPVANTVGPIIPDPVDQRIANFASNLGTPQDVVNNTLQGNIDGAVRSSFRFATNSTLGVLGLFDVASAMGVEAAETDFGETLHVWGVGEGAYVELPFLGPSTERDAMGKLVDVFTDPLSYVIASDERVYGTAAGVATGVDRRQKFGRTIDSVLYDSADSYSQLRLSYIQNRRFELGQDAPGVGAGSSEDDLYDDLYFE